MTLAIRARDASPGLVEEVKKQIWSMDGQIPVGDVHAMDELIAVSLAQQRFNMMLVGTFAAVALLAVPVVRAGEGCHGTKIDFVDTPKEAAAQAKKEQKLVFVLHVSGHFEDPRFT